MSSTATGPVFGPHPGAPHAHEQVVFGADEATGLRAIIGIYSTALGPALGGTRFYPYAGEAEALADVLDLSRAMAYKNALAGLDHGGGKAVIIGDPAIDKTEALLLAYGRFVERLGGRYVTACDVGTYVADMDVVARGTRFATGRSPDARRRRRLVGAHRVRRVPGHAGRRRAPVGRRRPWPAGGSASPGSARSAGTWSAHLVEDGADRRGHRFAANARYLRGHGLEGTGASGHVCVDQGGTGWATVQAANAHQVRDGLVARGRRIPRHRSVPRGPGRPRHHRRFERAHQRVGAPPGSRAGGVTLARRRGWSAGPGRRRCAATGA